MLHVGFCQYHMKHKKTVCLTNANKCQFPAIHKANNSNQARNGLHNTA